MYNNLERMKLRTQETDEAVLIDCLECAKAAIQSRRYPFGEQPEELERRYEDLQYRIAVEIYYRAGAEGEVIHKENGIDRTYDNAFVSEQLLSEVVPRAGVVS